MDWQGDVEPDTLNISVDDMARKITPTTRAVVITHYGGQSCDMEPILKLAAEHGLSVIEDAAHEDLGGLTVHSGTHPQMGEIVIVANTEQESILIHG